jgi:hypothetical protein
MTAYAPLTLGQTFGMLADEQAQQQTAYLLLKGKAEEQLGRTKELSEAFAHLVLLVGLAIERGDDTARDLVLQALTYLHTLGSQLGKLHNDIKHAEDVRG